MIGIVMMIAGLVVLSILDTLDRRRERRLLDAEHDRWAPMRGDGRNALPCPRCGARTGEPCRTNNAPGRPASEGER